VGHHHDSNWKGGVVGDLTFNEWCRIYDPGGPDQPNWGAVKFVLVAIALLIFLMLGWEYLC
jgi:hypothetical protein